MQDYVNEGLYLKATEAVQSFTFPNLYHLYFLICNF